MDKTLLTAGTAFLLAAGQAIAEPKTYLEFAVYEVGDPATFSSLRHDTVQRMESQEGFLWWLVLEGDGGLLADVVAWSTPDTARIAAQRMQTDEAFRPFVQGISKIHHFAHYWVDSAPEPLFQKLQKAPLIEIALYTVKDRPGFEATRPEVYARLQDRNGLIDAFPLRHDEGGDGFGDLLTWQDRQSFEDTGAALSSLPELAPFFQGVGKTYVFALFWQK